MSPDSEGWYSGITSSTASGGLMEYSTADGTVVATAYQITVSSSGTAIKGPVALVNVTGGDVWISINGSPSTSLTSSSWILLAPGSSFQAYSSNPGI